MQKSNRSARLELLVIGVVALTFAILELYIDSFERIVIWAAENESLFVTELLTLAILLSIGLTIYSYRRWREIVKLEEDNIRLEKTVIVEQDANESLRLYSDAVTQGQEAERRRLARELHDDTVQRLIHLNQKVELAAFDHADSPAFEDLEQMKIVVNDTIDHMRHFIQELRPSYLDELGLVAALRNLTKQTRERTDLFVECEVSGDVPRLNEAIELGLYRITQSALANVMQHADATQVSVSLIYTGSYVQLEIEDDGQGFVINSEVDFAREGHYGLMGMRERSDLIGATFLLDSKPDDGARIRVVVPLDN